MTLPLNYSNIYFLLFDEASGACVKLTSRPRNDVNYLIDQFSVIDKVWSSPPSFSPGDNHNVTIEKFIDWSYKFLIGLLNDNVCLSEAARLIDYMIMLSTTLSSESVVRSSQFNQDTFLCLFNMLQNNGGKSPKGYMDIFQKLCKLYDKVFADESLLCTVLGTVSVMMKNNKFTTVLEDLITYSRTALSMHMENLDSRKVDSESVINSCLKVIQVPVRSERHAVGRIHFWWQLLCSMKRETFVSMIDRCLLPFLSNLFGKYLSLEETKSFNYILSEYNCITSPDSMGPLCHHAMMELLSSISGSVGQMTQVIIQLEKWSGTMLSAAKKTSFDMLSLDFILGNDIVELHLESLLVVFGYWCQFSELIGTKLPGLLFKNIFFVLSKGLITNARDTVKDGDIKFRSLLCRLITIVLAVMARLDRCLTVRNAIYEDVFLDHVATIAGIVKVMLETKGHIGAVAMASDELRQVTLSLLLDCVKSMSHLIVSTPIEGKSFLSGARYVWNDSCECLIDLLWPGGANGIKIDQKSFSEELREVIDNWCLATTAHSVNYPSMWTSNVKVWTTLATKMFHYINTDDHSLDFAKEVKHLMPYIDLIASPVSFLRRMSVKSLTKSDFIYVRDVSDGLVKAFARKVGVMSGPVREEWCMALSRLLLLYLSDESLSNDQILSLNVTSHIVHVLVDSFSTPSIGTDNYKGSAVWHCATVLAAMFTQFDKGNVQLFMKHAIDRRQVFTLKRPESDMTVDGNFTPISEPDFTLYLTMASSNRLIYKLSNNYPEIEVTLKSVLPAMAGALEKFFVEQKYRRGMNIMKHIPQLQEDTAKIEKELVCLLKYIKAYCHKIHIFPSVEYILQVLFSFHDDMISPFTMKFVVEFWNESIFENIKKFKTKLSSDFLSRMREVTGTFPTLKLPHTDDERVTLKSLPLKVKPEQSINNLTHNQRKNKSLPSVPNNAVKKAEKSPYPVVVLNEINDITVVRHLKRGRPRKSVDGPIVKQKKIEDKSMTSHISQLSSSSDAEKILTPTEIPKSIDRILTNNQSTILTLLKECGKNKSDPQDNVKVPSEPLGVLGDGSSPGCTKRKRGRPWKSQLSLSDPPNTNNIKSTERVSLVQNEVAVTKTGNKMKSRLQSHSLLEVAGIIDDSRKGSGRLQMENGNSQGRLLGDRPRCGRGRWKRHTWSNLKENQKDGEIVDKVEKCKAVQEPDRALRKGHSLVQSDTVDLVGTPTCIAEVHPDAKSFKSKKCPTKKTPLKCNTRGSQKETNKRDSTIDFLCNKDQRLVNDDCASDDSSVKIISVDIDLQTVGTGTVTSEGLFTKMSRYGKNSKVVSGEDCYIMDGSLGGARSSPMRCGASDSVHSPLVIGRTFSMAHETEPSRQRENFNSQELKQENVVCIEESIVSEKKREMSSGDRVEDTKKTFLLSVLGSSPSCNCSSTVTKDQTPGCRDMLPNSTNELNRFKEALRVVKEGLKTGSYERYRETMEYLFNKD